MTEPRAITKDSVAALLASALGQEKSDEVVLGAAHDLGIEGKVWTRSEVRAIVEALSKAEGLVGVVARFALARGDVERLVTRSVPPEAPTSSPPKRSSAAPTTGVDLVALLAPALGAEKARDATETACRRLGVDARALSHDEALFVLDEIGQNDGIVGVVARFAKARLRTT
ncbi:MAG: hypothetical protein JST00_02820 [Deltaproteobacteria bacterium]|nr:hypothetical protein [Deltaproteobacteria bacterium]